MILFSVTHKLSGSTLTCRVCSIDRSLILARSVVLLHADERRATNLLLPPHTVDNTRSIMGSFEFLVVTLACWIPRSRPLTFEAHLKIAGPSHDTNGWRCSYSPSLAEYLPSFTFTDGLLTLPSPHRTCSQQHPPPHHSILRTAPRHTHHDFVASCTSSKYLRVCSE